MLERVISEIEKEAMKTGKNENVSIILNVTEAEKQKFLQECDNLDEHWNWDILDNELHVNYTKKNKLLRVNSPLFLCNKNPAIKLFHRFESLY